jgi:NAD(P)H-hydrate epimerase
MTKITSLPPLPPRPSDGHKGTFGRVLIVGGNDNMIGAPAFAGYASLRTGSGLVQIATPRSILPHSLSICPELIGLGLGKSAANDALLDAAEKADAVAIGPGLGQSPEALARLRQLVRLPGKPMVLDADALNLLSKQKRWPTYVRAQTVLTPHPGEMKRLLHLLDTPLTSVPTDDADRIELASLAARTFNCVLLLKGHRTIIADGSRYRLNTTGDSTLAKAGTGDVLTGIITSLLGQHMSPFDAASLGAHLHGLAGQLAGKKLGQRSALAREVIDSLPQVLAHDGCKRKE